MAFVPDALRANGDTLPRTRRAAHFHVMRIEKKNLALMANNKGSAKSLESWIWDAACSIRGAKDAPKYKDYILPLTFTKRLCDVFDDEVRRERDPRLIDCDSPSNNVYV